MPISSRQRERILGKVDTGELIRQKPTKMYAGYGSGERCAACDGVVGSTEIEYEMHFGGGTTYRMHWNCVGAWQSDRERGQR